MVGGKPGKVQHVAPMLSLQKCTGPDGFGLWAKGRSGPFVARPKYDGLAVDLEYAEGQLWAATTRGDGEYGEDATDNVQGTQGVPGSIPGQVSVHVRGEAVLPVATHNPSTDFTTHPRNIAAGILARKTQPLNGLGPKDLRFYAYDIVGFEGDEKAKTRQLTAWGFIVGPVVQVYDSTEGPDGWFPDRDKWDFPADGVVIREMRSTSESTAHHPKHSIAWKFAAQTSRSVARSVEWQVTRQGTLTPVAVFDTVQADGALVSRATLHNLGRLETLGLCYADRIEITRRGGVIPHLERVIQPSGMTPFAPPTHCPECGHTLLREPVTNSKGEKADTICCPNKSCPAQLEDALRYWCACLEMDGFGPAVCEKLAARAAHPSGLYLLNWSDSWAARAFGAVTAKKLAKELQTKSASATSIGLLTAMGLPGVGHGTAKDLATRWDFEDVFSLTEEDLLTVPGIGPVLAASIVAGLAEWAPYMALLVQGQFIPLPKKIAAAARKAGPLTGEVICFTGELSQPRKQMAALALEAGALVDSGVTKATTVLVAGADEMADQQSAKFRKAVLGGVTVWDEATFRARVAR